MTQTDKAVRDIVNIVKPSPPPVITYGMPNIPPVNGKHGTPTAVINAALKVAEGFEPGATIEMHTRKAAEYNATNIKKHLKRRGLSANVVYRGTRVYITPTVAATKR